MKKINIAIDGPAGSGKGTVAKEVAKKLGYLYIDSGAMYRLLTFLIIRKKVNIEDDEKIKEILINEFDYEIRDEKIYFNEEDVSEDIRSKEVNELVSKVAGKQYVRDFLIGLQKVLASEKGVIMDGRDITSVVLKDAEVKIYLDADFEVRVQRRYKQEMEKNNKVNIDGVREIIKLRDYGDMNINKTLVKENDAVYIDTTKMTIEEVVNRVSELVRESISNG